MRRNSSNDRYIRYSTIEPLRLLFDIRHTVLRSSESHFVLEEGLTKRRGNPNFGKPAMGPLPGPVSSSFEDVVKKMRLNPAEYQHSRELKDWVQRNKDSKYVPTDLLKAWGLEVKGEL